MHPSQLKIKPPPIQVSPIAIIGAAAVVGTISASLCIDSSGLFITTAVSVATIFSVLGLCIGCGSNTTVMLCVATTGLFFARFHQLAQATPPAWVVVLEGEHVELSRFSRDRWTIPTHTDRYVTCVDGNTTTTIDSAGVLKIITEHTGLATTY